MKNIYKLLIGAGAIAACAAGYCYLDDKTKSPKKPRLRLPSGEEIVKIRLNDQLFEELLSRYRKSFDPILNSEIKEEGRLGYIYGAEVNILASNYFGQNSIKNILIVDTQLDAMLYENTIITYSQLCRLIDACIKEDPELQVKS